MAGILSWIEGHQALAGWVQAAASVAAIWWAGRLSTKLQRADRLHARRTLAETVLKIAEAAVHASQYVIDHFPDRQSVHDVAEGRKYFDRPLLKQMDESVSAIPLHELNTAGLVIHVILLGQVTRRLRGRVENTLDAYQQLDASDFEFFFEKIENMRTALQGICGDIETELKSIR